MKNGFLTLLFLCAIISIHAQELTRKYFIGGSFGIESTSGNMVINGSTYNDPNAYGYYTFIPSVGYYFNDNLAIGFQLGYTSGTNNSINDYIINTRNSDSIVINNTKTTNQVFTFAPLLRYSTPIVGKIGFNLNFTLPFSYTRYFSTAYNGMLSLTTIYNTLTSNYSIFSFGVVISPGLQWFINNNIALISSIGSLSYTHSKINAIGNEWNPSSVTNGNDLKLSLTTGISLGATFYFGGKNTHILPYSQ